MTPSLVPTMLWERTDPVAALQQRFRFVDPQAAVVWLTDTVARHYGLAVLTVDRLTMSAYNLLAWLTTPNGRLLAKCCAYLPAHALLLTAGELVVWLAQQGLPVAAPLPTQSGPVQVMADQLSLGIQPLITGELLDPTDLVQAAAAGRMLAHLHQALAAYPQAAAFAGQATVPPLTERIATWAGQKLTADRDPGLLTAYTALQAQAATLPPHGLEIQLVQRDYRAANILWADGQITAVLDFEETRWGHRVNDLAWAAIHLGTRYHNWGPVSAAVHAAFLASYQAVQPLTATEEAWLPALLTWHSIALACS